MKRLWVALAIEAILLFGYPHVFAFAQPQQGSVDIWNGTKVALKFSAGEPGNLSSFELVPNGSVVLRCNKDIHISITTEANSYDSALSCGGRYALYYNGQDQRYAVKSLPTVESPYLNSFGPQQNNGFSTGLSADMEGLTPFQQLLQNQSGAAANRAAAGANASTR